LPGGRSPVFGNVLRHDYPRVKDPRVWQIVTNDLPPLKGAVEAMLRAAEEAGRDRA
jgi:uncharacterized protein with HEPN domain